MAEKRAATKRTWTFYAFLAVVVVAVAAVLYWQAQVGLPIARLAPKAPPTPQGPTWTGLGGKVLLSSSYFDVPASDPQDHKSLQGDATTVQYVTDSSMTLCAALASGAVTCAKATKAGTLTLRTPFTNKAKRVTAGKAGVLGNVGMTVKKTDAEGAAVVDVKFHPAERFEVYCVAELTSVDPKMPCTGTYNCGGPTKQPCPNNPLTGKFYRWTECTVDCEKNMAKNCESPPARVQGDVGEGACGASCPGGRAPWVEFKNCKSTDDGEPAWPPENQCKKAC